MLFIPYSFADNYDQLTTVNLRILEHGENRYFVSMSAPQNFMDFKFAMYKKLKNGDIAFYKLSNNRTTFILAEVFTRVKLHKLKKIRVK
jgi:hypothetical protein